MPSPPMRALLGFIAAAISVLTFHQGMWAPQHAMALRRMLDLGVIKRVTGSYRYYLTKAGRAATAAAERITQAVVVPTMI